MVTVSSRQPLDGGGKSPTFNRGEPIEKGLPTAPDYDKADTVEMFFPKALKLTLRGHTQLKFQPGLQQVPREFADDPWLKANGVSVPSTRGPLPLLPQAQPGTMAYAATVMRGAGIYDATEVPNAITTDSDVAAAEQMAQMAAQNVVAARDALELAMQVQASSHEALVTARTNYDKRRATAGDAPQLGGDGNSEPDTIKSLNKADRAKFDRLSDGDKAKYLAATDDAERAIILG